MNNGLSTLLLGLLLPATIHAQQWYCQNENNGQGIGYNCTGGISFVAGGKGFFGYGLDQSGQASAFIAVYDPATNVTTYPGVQTSPRAYATAFGIGNNAYIGLGVIDPSNEPFGYPAFHPDFFYVFNAGSGDFVDMVQFPGGLRRNAIAFTIGNVAYVGGGQAVDSVGSTAQFIPVNDLWAFDQTTHTWTAKANLPTTFTKAKAFTVAGKGYLMQENSTSLWEYDPVGNAWVTRASFPGGVRTGSSAFALNGLAYVGCGRSTSDHQDFYAFNPATNTWAAAPSLWDGFGRAQALALTIGDSGYLIAGQRGGNSIRDAVWRFGPATATTANSWTQRPFLPAAGRSGAIAFSIGNRGYVGGGGSRTDFWEYDPATQQWTERASLPGPVEEGFSIDGLGYATRNLATGNFLAYDPTTNTWTPRADLPGGARSLAASFAMEGKGYICSGSIGAVRQSDLWEYDPIANSWTQRADRPGNATHSASGFAIGNKGYVMGGNLNGSSTSTGSMHRYDPANDTWTTMGSIPLGNKQSAQAFAVGNTGYLGGGFTGGPGYLKRFDTYNPATNTWTAMGDLGGNYRYDGVGFAIGTKGYLFGGQRNFTSGTPSASGFSAMNDLWEFNPTVVELNVRVVLDGPYNGGTELMNDALRATGRLPLRDPYRLNGYPHNGGNYSDRAATIPSTVGVNAVVDRVVVELRHATNAAQVLATRHVWVQRDGDIVDMDGTSPVRFTLPLGSYHVAIRHRNHLAVMSATPLTLGNTVASIDFSSPTTATFGTNARRIAGGVARLWCGNSTFDHQVKYVGLNNDRDPILARIGGSIPTATVEGYFVEDVNLDGVVKYAGEDNDRDPILMTVGTTVPTNVRTEQLP